MTTVGHELRIGAALLAQERTSLAQASRCMPVSDN